ncbi:hypothetical protein Asp14428_13300 [Actinoplanes sp. NBRC 14428]|nr:hypothetical protein Asp14428_13300 [Actinoplanes sp. NBRC 14428]
MRVRLLPRPGPPRVVAVTTAVALAAGATGWAIAAGVKSPADAAAGRQPPPASLITVPVERRPLAAVVVVQTSVTYRKPTPVVLTGAVAPLDGDLSSGPVVTKAATAGRTVREGDVLMEINGRPVFALAGRVPMYRTLTEGSTGDDVRQLRAALRRLRPGAGLAASGPLTGEVLGAAAAWYRDRGYEPVLPTAAQLAERRRLEARKDARAELAEWRRTRGARIYSGEIVFLPRLPARVTTVTARAGREAAGEVATVADPAPVIDGTVTPEDAELLRKGQPATLTSPSGKTYRAKVTAVGASVTDRATPPKKEPDAKDDDGAPVGVPIRLGAAKGVKLGELTGQSVRTEITVGDSGGAVLAVPVAAVFTSAGGQAYVTVDAGAGTARDVPVTTGLAAEGYVEVTPGDAGLAAGDRVVVGGS